MSGDQRISQLHIRTAVLEGRPSTIITIDGADVLQLQRPARSPSGSLYQPDDQVFIPANPTGLLPPDSCALLPAAAPRHAMIGICSCGEAGDASLWLQVRRDDATVIWEPDPNTPRASIDTTYIFDLHRYLDALDHGQQTTHDWERRHERLARELRTKRDSLFGFLMIERDTRARVQLLDATAWPGHDHLLLTVATRTGIRQLDVPLTDEVTDLEFYRTVNLIDLDRYTV